MIMADVTWTSKAMGGVTVADVTTPGIAMAYVTMSHGPVASVAIVNVNVAGVRWHTVWYDNG